MTETKQSGVQRLERDGITWLCVEKPSKAIFESLEQDYKLHPVHLKESTQTIQLTQVEREDHYIFLLVHLPTYDAATDRIMTSQVGVFLGHDFLITIHDGRQSAITDLFKACLADEAVANAYCKDSSGYLLYGLLKQLLEDVTNTIETLLNELDTIEIVVFDNNKSDAYQIGKLRQKIIRLKRVVDPLETVLNDLAQQINTFSHEHLAKYYSNNAKMAKKLTEVVAEAQETIEIFKDADFTTSTEQTNRILAILTLVFTFTIPVTVMGTLYGMNVPLPGGLSTHAWTFLGPYTTEGLIISGSVGAALAMYAFFKNKRWF
ncbi:MAG: magnesium transporter CorA family protein [Patescibacteria group bacterium]|nr:magnesium transporter CorA family protein [Patescibacteria group bacterium]